MKRTRLIQRRRDLNLTQDAVAKAIGVTRPTYVRYETGTRTPSLDIMLNIAEALRSDLDSLFGRDVPVEHTQTRASA